MSTTTRSSHGRARASEAAKAKRSESGTPVSGSKVLMEPALMATTDVSVTMSRSTGVPGPGGERLQGAVVGLVVGAGLQVRCPQPEEAAVPAGDVEGVGVLVEGHGRGRHGQLPDQLSLARS